MTELARVALRKSAPPRRAAGSHMKPSLIEPLHVGNPRQVAMGNLKMPDNTGLIDEATAAAAAALFAPDAVRETFRERSGVIEGKEGSRSMRCLEWHWDPDPSDDTYVVDFAFLLRENGTMRSVHDRHLQGLFARERWLELLKEAGYVAEPIRHALDEPGEYVDMFLCARP